VKARDTHPTEQQLVRAADGELQPREAELVRAHLTHCRMCRAYVSELNQSMSDFVHLYQSEMDEQLPSITRARLRLRTRLAQAANAQQNRPGRVILLSKLAYVAAAALFAVGAALIATHRFRSLEQGSAVPRSSLTPGDVVFVSRNDVCTRNLANDPAEVPTSLRQAVFDEYGIRYPSPHDYELDYLITPKLGGTTSLRNLWPEPYSAKWNARVKDQLEDRLQSMVCRGEIDLATAQHDIATDWVGAYRKYFHSRQPIDRR
jgi:Putative zinc-finger